VSGLFCSPTGASSPPPPPPPPRVTFATPRRQEHANTPCQPANNGCNDSSCTSFSTPRNHSEFASSPASVSVPASEADVAAERLAQAGRIPAERRGHVNKSKASYMRPKLISKVKNMIGEFNLKMLHNRNSSTLDRRMILAIGAVEKARRRELEAATNLKISEREFTEIKIHAKFPGPMKKEKKETFRRARVKGQVIQALLHCLESGGKLQRNAFGTKVIEICGGLEHVTIENIERTQRVSQIAAQFVVSLCDEAKAVADGDLVLPDDDERCKRLERDSYRRCLCDKGHDTKCKFTPKGSLSMTKASELVKLLSGADIKKLSGLDDIKVEQGRENFISLRKTIDSLFSGEEAHELKKQVNGVENFHKTDFDKHLERQSEYSCACLTCGFHDPGKSTLICCISFQITSNLFNCHLQPQTDRTTLCVLKGMHTNARVSTAPKATQLLNCVAGNARRKLMKRLTSLESNKWRRRCTKSMCAINTLMSTEATWLGSRRRANTMPRSLSRCLTTRPKSFVIGK
jgi:hypothetical protein